MVVERLVHGTSMRRAAYPSFDIRFPKLPSYLRRSAIFDAVAAVMLYRKNLADWEASDRSRKKPRLNRRRNAMPAFYRGNMFILDKTDGASRFRRKGPRFEEGAAAPLEEEGHPEAYGSPRT